MKTILLICVVLLAIIFAFIMGWHYAIHKKAKHMIDDMLMGEIILDISSVEEDTIKCQFDRNPKEMMDKNYIMLEVKIRQ
jgi:preprotein translocase subunit YajC